jgi:hypothetical protein
MRLQEIQNDWWIPIEDEDWITRQMFDYERELYELREWWCRPRQITNQLDLPLDEPQQPQPINPF